MISSESGVVSYCFPTVLYSEQLFNETATQGQNSTFSADNNYTTDTKEILEVIPRFVWTMGKKTNFNRLNDSWNGFKGVDFSVDTKGGAGEKLN